MKAAAIITLVFTGAVAGCVEPDRDGGSETRPAEAVARTLPWGVSGCAFAIVAIQVDEAELAARLPEAFALRPGGLPRLPAAPRASLELDVYACASGVGLNGTVEPIGYGSAYAAVDVPSALREDGYGAYFVKWDFLVPDADRRAVLVAGGLPARAGAAEVALPSASGGPIEAELTLDGAWGFGLTGVVGALEPQGGPLPFMEYTPLADRGLARWHARLHDAEIGTGTGVVTLTPGSWVADLAGADTVPATFIAGVWNLDQADVTFPVAWPAA